MDAPGVIDICRYRYILDQTAFLYLPPHHHQQQHRLARSVGVGPAGYVWDRQGTWIGDQQGTWVGDVCIGPPLLAVCLRTFELCCLQPVSLSAIIVLYDCHLRHI